jgi:signal transduction histidine kinase/ActR/RegA family two-component response regulator
LRTNSLIFILILLSITFISAQEASDLNAIEKTKIKDSIVTLLNKSYDADQANQVKRSIEYANRAIKFSSQIDDKLSMYHAYNNIGINYEKIKEYSSAEYSYNKALSLALDIKNDTLKIWSYNNLGNVYSDGYKKIDLGLEYYKKSLTIAKKIKDTIEMTTPIINIGWTYIDSKDYDKALPYLLEGYDYVYSNKSPDYESKVHINFLLARYYHGKNRYTKAWDHLSKATELAKKKSMILELTEIYHEHSALFEDQGMPEKALKALKQHNEYRAAMTQKNREREIQLARSKFDFAESKRNLEKAEKERELQETIAKRSRIITFISVIVVIVMFVLLMALYKNYADKNKMSRMLKAQNEALEKSKVEAEKLSQLKTQFISTVSHELRTPLYGVVGLTSLLLEESNLSEKEHQYLNSLKFSGDYLLNLINDVLQLSKIESNKLKLEETDFSINALFSNIVNSFEYQLEQTKIKIHVEIDPSIPKVLKGDMVRLSQVLINLIGNSIKFTPNGDIWFRAINAIEEDTASGQWMVRFEVEDNGIGIPKEKQKEIFENFSQIDRDHIDFQGTGLGLSIVKKLVDLFGGTIELRSERGNGAKFSFAIPFKIGNSLQLPEQPKTIEQAASINNKILIVEDNKINQIVTQNILNKENFVTSVVDNGLDAIEAVRNNNFDLVLMDLNMPRMNGFDATQKIREFNQDIPIIALTAVAIDEIKLKVFESGLTDIINKPYDNQEFFQVILKNLQTKEKNFT